MAEKCNNCGANVVDATILNDGGVNCPNCGQRIDNHPVTRQQIETIWATVQMPADDLDVTIKSDGKPRSDSVASRLNLITKPVAQQGEAIEPPPHYEIEKFLGEGGMGVIYRARQTSIDRSIALKMIKPGLAQEKGQRIKFLSEAVAIGDLDHPNIVPIYDLGANEEGILFYAMKEIKGTPWSEVIGQKALAENLDILMSVADATAFAHSRGVIHRDIKPENVMLGDYGEILLVDWGLAAAVAEDGKADKLGGDAVAGTPGYMPPEMALGDSEAIGTHSDVYLLGAVLYEIITGNRPHQAEKIIDRLLNASNNVIAQTDEEGELVDTSLKAMATEPCDRHGSVKEFQGSISEYLTHAESVAIVALANEHLAAARASREYDEFSEAVFGFRQALKLWFNNGEAESGLVVSLLAYAECALVRGDLDLASSLLDANIPDHEDLLAKIDEAKALREKRRRRVKVLTVAAATLVVAVIVVVVGASIWIQREQAKQAQEQQRAAAAELDQLRAEKKAQMLELQRQEEWIPVVDTDFSDGNLPEGFEAVGWGNPERFDPKNVQVVELRGGSVRVANGVMTIEGRVFGWASPTVVRHRDPLGEDVRIEADVINNGTIALAVGGDAMTGYRTTLDLTSGRIWMDKGGSSDNVTLQSSAEQLPPGQVITVRVEKVGQTVTVWVQDEKCMEFFDPVPLSGKQHRTVSVSNWGSEGHISRLRVWKRRTPELVPVLNEGRALLRCGNFAHASVFFETQAAMHNSSELAMEAILLLGIVKESAGDTVGALEIFDRFTKGDLSEQTDDKKRLQLRHAAIMRVVRIMVAKHDFTAAAEMARLAVRTCPGSVAPNLVTSGITDYLGRHSSLTATGQAKRSTLRQEELETYLRTLAQVPGVKALRISKSGLHSLHGIEESAVEILQIDNNLISDLVPLRGLRLSLLSFRGNAITDLSPLRGMPLTSLSCDLNKVSDLAPLKGMALTALRCSGNQISDLSPLQGMPLTLLSCSGNPISNLGPLEGMPLQDLQCHSSRINDLSPIHGAPLMTLSCGANLISDLSPLRGMPLTNLKFNQNRISDLAPLRGMRLETLWCYDNQIRDLSPLEGMSLVLLMCAGNQIHDLSPLKGMPLTLLNCAYNQISDLSPLRGMSLTSLACSLNQISDLSPLQGMRLEALSCNYNRIIDLSPLKGMRLRSLSCFENQISDLSPLQGMPLASLSLSGKTITRRNTRIIQSLPLKRLHINGLVDLSDVAFVRRLPSLETLNGLRLPVEDSVAFLDAVRRSLQGEDVDLLPYASTVTNGFRWLVVPDQMTRKEASMFCRRQGGYLASPSTKTKIKGLCDHLVSRTRVGRFSRYIQIGATYDRASDEWSWDSGEVWADALRWRRDRKSLAEDTGWGILQISKTAGILSSSEKEHSFIIEWKVDDNGEVIPVGK